MGELTPKWRRRKNVIVGNHRGLGVVVGLQETMRRTCTFGEGGDGLSGWRKQCEQSHRGQRQLEFHSK